MSPADRIRRQALLPSIAVLVAVILAVVLSQVLPGPILYLGITAVIVTIPLLGLGVVTGTARMIVLSQMAFAAVGAWVVAWLTQVQVPGGFLVYLVIGGAVAAVAGLLLGVPALRLRGINLAVVTLGFAAAVDVTLVMLNFPGASQGLKVQRPSLFSDDRAFFVFVALVAIVIGIVLYILQRSRTGSAWRTVAFSERATAALGLSVRSSKLSAFAIAAAIGGIAGGLMLGQVGTPYSASFGTVQSLALYVLALVVGSQVIGMALFGGILWVLIPELLKRLGVPQDWGLVLFGALGIQALASGSNLGETIVSVLTRRRKAAQAHYSDDRAEMTAPVARTGRTHDAQQPLLTLCDVGVRFGAVAALTSVNFTVREGAVVGLIGPNGAGKSTIVDVITGFLPSHTGEVGFGGRASINGWAPDRRARAGLRRTFQQGRVPPTLTIGAYLRLAADGRTSEADERFVLDYFGLPSPETPIARVDVGSRRLIEVAGNVLAGAKLMVLDEPAAGLSHEAHVMLGERLALVPDTFGISVLLIEHDLDLVRAACDSLVVLNFGEVIAAGEVEAVLADREVVRAYLGDAALT